MRQFFFADGKLYSTEIYFSAKISGLKYYFDRKCPKLDDDDHDDEDDDDDDDDDGNDELLLWFG